jgi:hypothetical protein
MLANRGLKFAYSQFHMTSHVGKTVKNHNSCNIILLLAFLSFP